MPGVHIESTVSICLDHSYLLGENWSQWQPTVPWEKEQLHLWSSRPWQTKSDKWWKRRFPYISTTPGPLVDRSANLKPTWRCDMAWGRGRQKSILGNHFKWMVSQASDCYGASPFFCVWMHSSRSVRSRSCPDFPFEWDAPPTRSSRNMGNH